MQTLEIIASCENEVSFQFLDRISKEEIKSSATKGLFPVKKSVVENETTNEALDLVSADVAPPRPPESIYLLSKKHEGKTHRYLRHIQNLVLSEKQQISHKMEYYNINLAWEKVYHICFCFILFQSF